MAKNIEEQRFQEEQQSEWAAEAARRADRDRREEESNRRAFERQVAAVWDARHEAEDLAAARHEAGRRLGREDDGDW